MAHNEIVIFGLTASKNITKKIVDKLNYKHHNITTFNFADGEILVKSESTIRNKDVFLIQSTCKPVNNNLMELLIAIDMLKRASAKTINVIIPYFGYARQDRKSNGREPISAKLVADFLETAGATKVILIDIHAEQVQGFFRIPVDTLRASGIIMPHVIKKHCSRDLCIVSPDYGGVKRARNIAHKLNVPLAIIDKNRPCPNEVEICNVLGEIENKSCLLVDDMIDTGNTIIEASKILKQRKAKSVVVMATHGVFSNDAINRFINAIDSKVIDDLYISDSIEENLKINHPNIHVISLVDLLSDVIKAHVNNESISELYTKYWKQIAHD